MNLKLIRQYIEQYKSNFSQINEMEIYKWQAVKHFQVSFNIEAPDFFNMLSTSLSRTANLMDSGNYFPRRMILRNAELSPEEVRNLFKDLFDQDTDRISRINNFSAKIKLLTEQNFANEGFNPYQDHRAILVYLCLMYPEDNYFYKFAMLNELVRKIGYNYKPKRGATSNITQFFHICELIKSEIISDNELIRLHHSRLGESEYFDTNLNILTQDFIYALTNHLDIEDQLPIDQNAIISTLEVHPQTIDIQLGGRMIDHISAAKKNKRIGDLGELFILDYERGIAPNRYTQKVTHDSKNIGDGLGYDIKSIDKNGKTKFIEVKTTKGPLSTPFYVTANELKCSLTNSDSFYLYRVFNFDEEKNSADIQIISGDLTRLCINPVNYAVKLKTT